MIGYASRTGTRRNLAALRAAGWRLLVSAAAPWRTEGFRYGIDNGAWSAFQSGKPFDFDAFCGCVDQLGAGADFCITPDIVGEGRQSLNLSTTWLPWVLERTRLALIAVQDGMTPDDVRPLLRLRVGLFVGGTTEWKLGTLPLWGSLARETNTYLHVGRVNTARRIRYCASVGAHSFDGTSVSRFAVTMGKLERARLWGGQQLEVGLCG